MCVPEFKCSTLLLDLKKLRPSFIEIKMIPRQRMKFDVKMR